MPIEVCQTVLILKSIGFLSEKVAWLGYGPVGVDCGSYLGTLGIVIVEREGEFCRVGHRVHLFDFGRAVGVVVKHLVHHLYPLTAVFQSLHLCAVVVVGG